MLRSAITGIRAKTKEISTLPRVVIAPREEPRVATLVSLYLLAVEGDFSVQSFVLFVQALQKHEPLTLSELWSLPEFLKFSLLEVLLDDLAAVIRSSESDFVAAVSLRLKSLRSAGNTDWTFLIEPLIVFDATLRQDPAQSYASMDFDSREAYRKRIAFVATRSDSTESEVAQAALDLARESARQGSNAHVGYYLIDKGLCSLPHVPAFILLSAIVFAHFFVDMRTISTLRHSSHNNLLYCSTGVASAVSCDPGCMPGDGTVIDTSGDAVCSRPGQYMVTSILDPMPLPKLDFSQNVPAEYTTLVTVPTLLLNENQVRRLITDLEIRYLANRDRNLHFALLTDLADSVTKPREKDFDPLVKLATQLVDELNAKYAHAARGSFILLHRHRIFNRKQGVWMGWERKRGKLLDLNKLMMVSSMPSPSKLEICKLSTSSLCTYS